MRTVYYETMNGNIITDFEKAKSVGIKRTFLVENGKSSEEIEKAHERARKIKERKKSIRENMRTPRND